MPKSRKSAKPTAIAAAPATSSRKKGFEKVMVRLESHQAQALRAEAFRRAQERGRGIADASEVVREIVEAWLAKRGR